MASEAAGAARRPGGTAGGRAGRDLTTGPIGKTLILFALPVLGSNILQSLNGSANAIWVSYMLGEASLAAISNSNQIFFLMLGTMFGFSMAANIIIGQAVGADDPAQARKVVGTCITFFILLSSVVGLAGFTLTPAILDAMGTPPDARAGAIAYLQVIFAAVPFLNFFTFMMMGQRGLGDARTPFLFSLLMVLLDVILNPLLIAGVGPLPRLGIAGSAASTLIAQMVTLAAMMAYLYRKDSLLALRPHDWGLLKPDLAIVRALLLKGVPMGFQMMVISLAAVTMLSFVNAHGIQVTAAYSAAAQLWTYVQMPAMALGAAVSAMAAQNVGAGRMDRVGEIARRGVLFAGIISTAVVLILLAGETLMLRAFLPAGSPALPTAVHINSIVLWGFIPFGMAFIFNGVVRATGAVWPPLLAMVIGLWGFRVPFALALEDRWGADAIWYSFPLGNILLMLLAGGYYVWGGWRTSRMMPGSPPATDEPDTGLGQPMIEEAEALADAASRSSPSGRNTPAS